MKIFLKESGFIVNNRGACTPLAEVFEATTQMLTLAIVLGSQNGHALEDISELNNLRKAYGYDIPVYIGGNLSVGANKADDLPKKFKAAGVDYLVSDFEELKLELTKLTNQTDIQKVSNA